MHTSFSHLVTQILPPHSLLPATGKRNHNQGIFRSTFHKNFRPTLANYPSPRVDCDRRILPATAQDYSETMEFDRSMELAGTYSEELEVAVKAVHMACLLCRGVQDSFLANSNGHVQSIKDDDSPVTVADWSVQATVSYILSSSFEPHNVSILAEEDARHLSKPESLSLLTAVTDTVNKSLARSTSFGLKPPPVPLTTTDILEAIGRCTSAGGPTGRFWVLDPVDGTLGFLRGDQYAVALSLIENGEPVIGVLGCPNYPVDKRWLDYPNGYRRIVSRLVLRSGYEGCVIYAKRGGGAWMQPLVGEGKELVWPGRAGRVHVSGIDEPGLATLCEPVEKANSSHSFTAGLAHSVGLRNQPLRVYSMVKYAAIARGDAEIFMKFARYGYKEKIWDHAAGVAIIQEAGGVVTDAGGHPLCFSKGKFLEGLDRGIIACSGARLHAKIISAVDASWNSSTL